MTETDFLGEYDPRLECLRRGIDYTPDEGKLSRIEAGVRDVLEVRRQEFLKTMFHVDENFPLINPDGARFREEQFLREKAGLGIQDTFRLSLSKPYFGTIYLTKLASTDHAEPDASQQMFDEMGRFMEWMKTEGPLQGVDQYNSNFGASVVVGHDTVDGSEDTEDHNDRWRSGRWMTYEYYKLPDVDDSDMDGDRVVITRIRPFANARTAINDVDCDIQIFKETVVTMPRALFKELMNAHRHGHPRTPEYSNGPDGPINEGFMRAIERYMYTSDGEGYMQRIKTSLFSAVCPAENSVQ
jgi:hypothetical protein